MTKIFNGKLARDTETAQETIISSTCFTSTITGSHTKPILSITDQQLSSDNFDNNIERRK